MALFKPEVIKQTGHGRYGNYKNRKADIWSLGCTIIEMATGKPPWSQYKNQVLFYCIQFTALYYIGNCKKPPKYPSELSATAHSFLNLIFQRNPTKRANVCTLLKHPFITGEDLKGKEHINENRINNLEKNYKEELKLDIKNTISDVTTNVTNTKSKFYIIKKEDISNNIKNME